MAPIASYKMYFTTKLHHDINTAVLLKKGIEKIIGLGRKGHVSTTQTFFAGFRGQL